MPELVFYRDGKEVLRYPLTGPTRVGRHPDNDMSLPDEGVSRYHCSFAPQGNHFLLTDQSRNGTFVNGHKVKDCLLKEKDEIQIGSWKVRFLEQEEWSDRATVLDKRVAPPETFCGMIGPCVSMQNLFRLVEKAAPLETPVLITGETGSGKELVARALHDLSPRVKSPYVVVNCGAISPQLIESEVFGHERGAFTGALDRHTGAFEQAGDGTLFLDEIGEMPLDLQPKLLRILDNQCFRRVGGKEEIRTRARVVAATNRHLEAEVQRGRFREDLFFRLYALPIFVPPLRERKEDLPTLVEFFLRQSHVGREKVFSESAWAKFKDYPWPGNLRELRNTVLRAVILATGPTIGPESIRFPSAEPSGGEVVSLNSAERAAIVRALREHNGNKRQAAKSLGIAKSTLYQKIRDLGI